MSRVVLTFTDLPDFIYNIKISCSPDLLREAKHGESAALPSYKFVNAVDFIAVAVMP